MKTRNRKSGDRKRLALLLSLLLFAACRKVPSLAEKLSRIRLPASAPPVIVSAVGELGTNQLIIAGGKIFDASGNAMAPVSRPISFKAMPPILIGAETLDVDKNGRIDHYRLRFNKAVSDSSFPNYVSNNALGNVTTNWQVAGRTNVRIDTRDSVVSDTDNDNIIFLAFDETSAACTAADATGCNTDGLPDLTSGNPGLNNGAGISVGAFTLASDVPESDGAPPVLLRALVYEGGPQEAGAGEGDVAEFLFSESTQAPTINSANVNSIFTPSAGHSWSLITGATWQNQFRSNDKFVFSLAAGGSPTVADGDSVTVNDAGGANQIRDAAGNVLAGQNIAIFGSFNGGPCGTFCFHLPFSKITSAPMGDYAMPIAITSGAHAGKYLIVPKNGSNTTTLYDPATDSYTAGPSVGLGAPVSYLAVGFTIPSDTHAGKYLLWRDGTDTRLYNPATHAFEPGPSTVASLPYYPHAVAITAGTHSGKIMLLGHASTDTMLYDPANHNFATGPTVATDFNSLYGAGVFSYTNGGNPKLLLVEGHFSNTRTFIYNMNSNTWSPGPSNCTTMRHFISAQQLASGQYLVFGGLASRPCLFNPATETFSAGPTVSQVASYVSGFVIPSGTHSGKVLFLTDVGSYLYDPASNTIGSGPTQPISPRCDQRGTFLLSAGVHAGKVMVLGCRGVTPWLYDPASHSLSLSESHALSATAGSGVLSFTIPSGPQAGNRLVIAGGSTRDTVVFNQASNAFAAGPQTLYNHLYPGDAFFLIDSGTENGKFLIHHLAAVNNTSYYNPATHSFSAGPTTGNFMYSDAVTFKITAGTNNGKFFIGYYDGASSSYVFNPGTNAWESVSGHGCSSAQNGSRAVVLPSNRVLVICGNSTTATRLYDMATSAWSAGDALPFTTLHGTLVIPITAGTHSGKFLVVRGGGGVDTALLDPAVDCASGAPNCFSSGPSLMGSDSVSTGSRYIAIQSGTHAGKYLIIKGGYSPETNLYDPNSGGAGSMAVGPNLPYPANNATETFAVTGGTLAGRHLVLTGNNNAHTVFYP